ncbi:MAG: alpha/beta fold hydrolase [Chlorobiota bacterium]
MKSIILLFFILLTLSATAEELKVNTYGDSNDKAIIFLHGGPGYNAANFDITTAERLSEDGFYVIVYDRRGEGRNEALEAKFTFEETFADINWIMEKYEVEKASFIGHSFGGIVATKYAEKFPDKVETVYLVGAPVSLQETFKTIISTVKKIYEDKGDATNLNYVKMLENMDTTSIQYSSYCFMHAMQNGFYTTKNPTDEAKQQYKKMQADKEMMVLSQQMNFKAPKGFADNESYTTIDLTEGIDNIMEKGVEVYGIYGKEDGLYSPEQVASLADQIGLSNMLYLDNCSHNVFVDRQTEFINAVVEWSN